MERSCPLLTHCDTSARWIAAVQPFTVPRTTAFTFTSSASISTVYCNAQGYQASNNYDGRKFQKRVWWINVPDTTFVAK